MTEILDLFGDPVPANFGGRGRPPHIPTLENRNKVKLLLALDWPDERIAHALAVSEPTLRKHYFRELKVRDEMRDRMESRYAMLIWAGVEKGNGTAIKEMRRLVERSDAEAADEKLRHRREPKAPKLGKKEERHLAAQRVSGEGRFAPPPAPMLVVDNR